MPREPIKAQNEALQNELLNAGPKGPAAGETQSQPEQKLSQSNTLPEQKQPEEQAPRPAYLDDPEYQAFLSYRSASPEVKQAFSKWYATNGQQAPISKEEAKTQVMDAMHSQFGKDYVMATKNGEERPFSRVAWDRMNGNKNQDGWVEVIQKPPEVKALEAKKAQ
jgi:hypothetical protein